jgi:GR25 family glycosyltransferase involved in LPS biosynthesis
MVTLTQEEKQSTTLSDYIEQVFIIAYKEPTETLEKCMREEGFTCEVLRQKHLPEYKDYSNSYLCLLNHCQAWKRIIKENKPTLITEADFVPVVNFSQLPLPFDPSKKDVGIAWLYTCAPQVYYVSPEGFATGFSTSAVAYIVTPEAAKVLITLEEKIKQEPGPESYSSWDSTIDALLREQKLKNYLPFRCYGEHGGLPNLEHYRNNLSKTHRADVLYGSLAFLPIYAQKHSNPMLAFWWERLQARIKGIGRLLAGKYLRLAILRRSNYSFGFLRFAIVRHLTFRF